jgi:hypothetical protein
MPENRRERIPVMSPFGVEFVDSRRAHFLAMAANATTVKARGGRIVRVILESFGDRDAAPARHGNPQRLCHAGETPTNPRGVWELKRLRAAAA